jgi:hydantoinase/carbamoylase family amidase
MMDDSRTLLARCDALAALSETPGMITRTYLTAQHAQANAEVAAWMRQAGLVPRIDPAGSIVGRYDGLRGDAPTVIIGSHLDSVRNAGRYDGILGVLAGIAAVDRLNRTGRRFPFAIEVVGFGEEEGVRFGTSLIGSRALAGSFDPAWLALRDEQGVTLDQALRQFGLDPAGIGTAARRPADVLAYLEVHIEQGPVLEQRALPVGVVSAICGATRRRYQLLGMAGHAGTVPMGQRRDALAAAAEMILAVERIATRAGAVGTVGRLALQPDAVNVIPGAVTFTLDLRAEQDDIRLTALDGIDDAIAGIAATRGVAWSGETFHSSPSVPCDPSLQTLLGEAIGACGHPVHRLASGAGHDAMAIAALAPVAMLFVRCAGGLSHHPAESVTAADVAVALEVLCDTLERLARR